jgi:hypothetical protein
MSTEDCKSILNAHGANLSRYTMGQIAEMAPLQKGKVFTPFLVITSAEGDILNTNITVEELKDWNER